MLYIGTYSLFSHPFTPFWLPTLLHNSHIMWVKNELNRHCRLVSSRWRKIAYNSPLVQVFFFPPPVSTLENIFIEQTIQQRTGVKIRL